MKNKFDVLIVGGSYAGLSAGLSLARANRSVLILDSGNPCNKDVIAAHNFIGHDGENPESLRIEAKKEFLSYPGSRFLTEIAHEVLQTSGGFFIKTIDGKEMEARKILFATGVADVLPGIAGFRECWGRTILHCPYCHGYEVRDQSIAILANGEHAFHLCMLLSNLSKSLFLYTNDVCTLNETQLLSLKKNNIPVSEAGIKAIEHNEGRLEKIHFTDGSSKAFGAAFAKVLIRQQCTIPEEIGCQFNEHLIKVDDCMRTSVDGIFAAGDNCQLPRTIAFACAAGVRAAFQINWDLSISDFS